MFDAGDPRHEVWAACESPIEQYLCTAMFAYLGCNAVSGPFDTSRLQQLAELAGADPACFLFSQHPIGIYRADFLLVVIDPARRISRRLCIECDGKHYHDKERDRQRDVDIGEAGYRVIRFTGSTIHRQMRSVVREIQEWLERCGVICKPIGGMVFLLEWFTPNSEYHAQAYERRQQQAREIEEEARLLDRTPDFVGDDGSTGQWRDTL